MRDTSPTGALLGTNVAAIESPEARKHGLVLGARYIVTVADPVTGLLTLELLDDALANRGLHTGVPAAAVGPYRGPRLRLHEDRIAEAWSDESGDSWWIHGHVTPEAAVLAVLLEQALTTDPATAIEVVFGLDHPFAVDIDDGAVKPYLTREADARSEASSLLDSVEHLWLAEDPANEEQVHRCAPWFPGAKPYTVVHR